MTDLLKMIELIENILRESYDPHVMRTMLRQEHRRLTAEFNRLEAKMIKELS